MDTVPAVND